ncbi:MAG TPA: formyltransferase family protein, partial [Exilispira sp.]|nr:formyltransferase family protein [Exilispira sp.]
EKEGIQSFCLNRKGKDFSKNLLSLLNKYADYIVCAGFLSIIDPPIIQKFKFRIINLHPALLPAFGGKGMFGNKVHRAVLDYGCKITGCTVHFVTDDIDGGPIILQYAIPVLDNDDEQSLAQRLSLFEHNILFESVKLLCENRLKVEGKKVNILHA